MKAKLVLDDLNGEPMFTIEHSIAGGIEFTIHHKDEKIKRYLSADEVLVLMDALSGRIS